MMMTNTVGAALFMRILLDKRAMFEKYTSAFSDRPEGGRLYGRYPSPGV
jgi:LytS/YehU family sensor histidine kinase